jgi:hypothetical protein
LGPASGSDPNIREAMARYVLTVFANGALLCPAQIARHMRDQVSAHERSIAVNAGLRHQRPHRDGLFLRRPP